MCNSLLRLSQGEHKKRGEDRESPLEMPLLMETYIYILC